MTRGPASSCVYIEWESRLYKAVCGLVLTTSVCSVPSGAVTGAGSCCHLSRAASHCVFLLWRFAAKRMITKDGYLKKNSMFCPFSGSHSRLLEILVTAPLVVGTITNNRIQITIVYSPSGTYDIYSSRSSVT